MPATWKTVLETKAPGLTGVAILGFLLVAALAAACQGGGAAAPTPAQSPLPPPTPSPAGGLPTPAPQLSPEPTDTPAGLTYTVQEGDTLSSIAARFGVTVPAIAQANGINDPSLIRPGQTLVIPGTGSPPPQPSSTPLPSDKTIGLLTIVDKQRSLPPAYVPPDLTPIPARWVAPGFSGQSLRAEAAVALVEMLSAALKAGHDIRVRSSYRSYDEQAATFQYWVSVLGEEEARRVSAEPGHSEHQLGTAADLTTARVGWDLVEAFGSTPEGRWLSQNAHKFGFALSYPQGGEPKTGYAYEPWHWRYIGKSHALAWAASGLTLLEYLEEVNV